MKIINLNKVVNSKSFLGRFIRKSLKSSQKSISILNDISMEINKGSINMIIGPNGAGKSTLGRIISHIDSNYSGTIIDEFKTRSYLPQFIEINPLLPIDAISFIDFLIKKKRVEIEVINKIQELIKDIDLKSEVASLSGGLFKRILLYSVFMEDSEIIVLDEPNQNLDLVSEKILYEIILFLKEKLNVSFIIISHDLHSVMKYADQIICINKNICCIGKPSDVIINDSFLSLYSHLH